LRLRRSAHSYRQSKERGGAGLSFKHLLLPSAGGKPSDARFRAGGEPNESVRRLQVLVLRGLRRETGIRFGCNPR
jgi:hypothetical protein